VSKHANKEEKKVKNPEEVIEKNPLEDELTDCKDRLLRQMAEFDNYKKRAAREREAWRRECTAECVSAFLPVLDNLYRACDNIAAPAVREGVENILKQFTDILSSLGVNEIEAQGSNFDPNLHDAVMHAEDENYPENAVAEVFSKGYILGDRVIRHCAVKVVN